MTRTTNYFSCILFTLFNQTLITCKCMKLYGNDNYFRVVMFWHVPYFDVHVATCRFGTHFKGDLHGQLAGHSAAAA